MDERERYLELETDVLADRITDTLVATAAFVYDDAHEGLRLLRTLDALRVEMADFLLASE